MNGKTHAGVAAVAYVALCDKLSYKLSFASISVLLLASLLPDIDHPKSMINKYILIMKNKKARVTLYFCSGIVVLWYNFVSHSSPLLKAIGISLIAIALSSHRAGITHSLTGLIAFSALTGYIGDKYHINGIMYWFILGYGAHLMCDMATNRGIALFYPFVKKKIKFPFTYSMNSKSGKLIESLIMVVGLVYIVYRLPHLKF